ARQRDELSIGIVHAARSENALRYREPCIRRLPSEELDRTGIAELPPALRRERGVHRDARPGIDRDVAPKVGAARVYRGALREAATGARFVAAAVSGIAGALQGHQALDGNVA